MRRARVLATLGGVALLSGLVAAPATASTLTTSHGTWTAYPGQSTTYQASIQQPINADGLSNFKANNKAVIPVKFALSQGTEAFQFRSIFSNNPGVTADDYSFLQFEPKTAPTLAEVTSLIATYNFTRGTCQLGSLRWTLYLNDGGTTRNLDVHYQPGENGVGDQFCQVGTSGTNRADLSSTDPYVVINQFTHAPYTFSSTYNVTYGEAVSQLGSLPVLGMNLILESGYASGGDQVVTLSNASVGVGGATPYTETFTPQPGTPVVATCPTGEAVISITKVDGSPSGDVNEPLTVQPQDNNGLFRIVDCKYMYNLATSSLSGVGTYTVKATIGTTTFTVATFDLK
jgi:hypothetical protein